VAGRHRLDPLVDRGGEARHHEELDHPAGHHHVLPVAGRHFPGALRRTDIGALSFATDPARGTFILLLLLVAIGGH
jgi:hypothetical protein